MRDDSIFPGGSFCAFEICNRRGHEKIHTRRKDWRALSRRVFMDPRAVWSTRTFEYRPHLSCFSDGKLVSHTVKNGKGEIHNSRGFGVNPNFHDME
jgi:hypothetical protein